MFLNNPSGTSMSPTLFVFFAIETTSNIPAERRSSRRIVTIYVNASYDIYNMSDIIYTYIILFVIHSITWRL